jgi:hypothetical protein
MSGDVDTVFSSANQRVYNVFFDHVRHENRLMLERMRNMLQSESLLLIAYAAAFNGVIGSGRAVQSAGLFLPLFQTLICIAGMLRVGDRGVLHRGSMARDAWIREAVRLEMSGHSEPG